MPVTSALVGNPMNRANVVFGLVADPKDPFFTRGVIKATLQIFRAVRATPKIFTSVMGVP